jgi:hypothetical protein
LVLSPQPHTATILNRFSKRLAKIPPARSAAGVGRGDIWITSGRI